MAKTAIVLFNLGGPDGPESVRPFLFNLFNDKAIIKAPQPMRWLLAQWISRRRAPVARKIYAHLGGASPLLKLTRKQGVALEAALGDMGDVKVFVCMRYWKPLSTEVAQQVRAWKPDEIVLLPLYPQFSATTSQSSLDDWARAIGRVTVPSRAICCYPTEPEMIAAQAELIAAALEKAQVKGPPRLLFSAHGLPKKVVDAGDPYQWQVEQTAQAVADKLDGKAGDWTVCYQSRVGPLEWIGPSTEDEIRRAGHDRVPLVVAPIAFVSEHSETLVELDIEYAELARKAGVPGYERVPALGTHPRFIKGLADIVRRTVGRQGLCSHVGGRACAAQLSRCPLAGS